MKKLVSKWFITKVFIGCGILSSFIILLIGFILGIMASNGLETIADSWVAFWAVFATYLYAALIILFSTAVFSVILVGICQVVDELRLIREYLTDTYDDDDNDDNNDDDEEEYTDEISKYTDNALAD